MFLTSMIDGARVLDDQNRKLHSSVLTYYILIKPCSVHSEKQASRFSTDSTLLRETFQQSILAAKAQASVPNNYSS